MVERLATEYNPPNPEATPLPRPQKQHERPDAAGKTPAEYAHAAMVMHNKQYAGTPPPALLKWMGDGQLAVLPKHRMLCAIGLTSGLLIAGNMAKIATGKGLTGAITDPEAIPTFLQKLHQMKFTEKWNGGKIHETMKNYTKGTGGKTDELVKYAQWGIYSLGGAVGIKIGSHFAYTNVGKKLANPHFLEDYLPRVSMHQGDTWSWLSAASGIFGSASSFWSLPIPGINYGLALAGRTTAMQDRNVMLPGLNDMISGGKSAATYMRMREGMNYLCHYATNNKAETPSQFEFLAYALLGPVFGDKLTTRHVEKFTEEVHSVRDVFWQVGGIPKEKRKDALKAMRAAFTGEGLEVTLINLGLNPGNIDFTRLNGAIGKIGNIAAGKKVHQEQEDYGMALASRLDSYVAEGLISQERADWAKAGIELRRRGKNQAALEPVDPPCELDTKPERPIQEHTLAANKIVPQPEEQTPLPEEPKFASESLKQSRPDIAAASGSFRERVSNPPQSSLEPMM